jgi:hypothetical protein
MKENFEQRKRRLAPHTAQTVTTDENIGAKVPSNALYA